MLDSPAVVLPVLFHSFKSARHAILLFMLGLALKQFEFCKDQLSMDPCMHFGKLVVVFARVNGVREIF